MKNSKSPWHILVILTLAVSGCSTLNEDKEVVVEPGFRKELKVTPASREQKIKVDVSSPGVPVSVYVVLEQHLKAATTALGANKLPPDLLAHKQNTEAVVLEPTVPANTAAVVVLESEAGKAAKVRVKLTN